MFIKNYLIICLIIWICFNFIISLYEIYVYKNRNKLKIQKDTWWFLPSSNYLLDSWSEYCKVDTRYIFKHYVWFFELFNAFSTIFIISIFLIDFLLFNISNDTLLYIIKIILITQIINCIGYFVSLIYEWIKNKNEITRYAKWWMYLIYYAISSIWIIVPVILIMNL